VSDVTELFDRVPALACTPRSVTDLPLVGPLFPDPTLHSRVSMRVEK